jgi:hypothetical protein
LYFLSFHQSHEQVQQGFLMQAIISQYGFNWFPVDAATSWLAAAFARLPKNFFYGIDNTVLINLHFCYRLVDFIDFCYYEIYCVSYVAEGIIGFINRQVLFLGCFFHCFHRFYCKMGFLLDTLHKICDFLCGFSALICKFSDLIGNYSKAFAGITALAA